jgi:hypothetical protein
MFFNVYFLRIPVRAFNALILLRPFVYEACVKSYRGQL